VSALEKGPDPPKPEHQQGYSALAKHMATSMADNSALIFRRFDQLNARNLLVLESQISSLGARLANLEKELGSKSASAKWLKDWDVLCQQAQNNGSQEDSVLRESARDPVLTECARGIVDMSKELEGLLGRYCMFRSSLSRISSLSQVYINIPRLG
jgi:hypothetical protein